MPDLSTREILESQFNGLTPIKRQNPRYGEKDYYYINPNRDKYSSLSDEDIAYVDSPDDPNPFLQQSSTSNPLSSSSLNEMETDATGLTGTSSFGNTSSLTNDTLTDGMNNTLSTSTSSSLNSDTTDVSTSTPRTVYQHLTGFKADNLDWYNNNQDKDNINLINDPNLYPTDRTVNVCDASPRFKTFTTNMRNREGNDVHTSDQLTNAGIAQSYYNQIMKKHGHEYSGYPKSVRGLTPEQIDNIYCHEYYLPAHIEAINNPHLAEHTYDMVVNPGYTSSTSLIQQAINMSVPQDQQIGVDGVLGTDTVTAFNNLTPMQLYNTNNNMVDLRKDYYRSRRNPKFINGWLDRAEKFRLE